MNKIITIITVCLMILSISFSASAVVISPDFANVQNNELDLSHYTVQDLAEMPAAELSALVADFERIYDPFGSYARRKAENIIDLTYTGNTVSPLWTSGEDASNDYVEGGHDVITAKACAILMNDQGFFVEGKLEKVVATLSICLASSLPDEDENDLKTYKGHFFDPDTGKNWMLGDKDTAQTNAVEHFQNAYNAAGGVNSMSMLEEIGRALHYVQDANVPYHAANVIFLEDDGDHSQFERYAFRFIYAYTDDLTTLASSNYTTVAQKKVADLVEIAARDAKERYPVLRDNPDRQDEWDTVARFCIRKSVKYSTVVLYKLGQKSQVPFYYN